MHHYGGGTGYGTNDIGDIAVAVAPFLVAAVVAPVVLRWRTRRKLRMRTTSAPQPQAAHLPDVLTELERLSELKSSGRITQAELDEYKRLVLSR